jgi:hypothetical protein
MQSIVNDNNTKRAVMTRGTRRYKKGGNPNWVWGCYSGGKSHTKRRYNTRYNRKSRRHRHY